MNYIDIDLLDSPEIVDLLSQQEGVNGLSGGISWKGVKRKLKKIKRELKKTGKKVVRTYKNIATLGVYKYQKEVSKHKRFLKNAKTKLEKFELMNSGKLRMCNLSSRMKTAMVKDKTNIDKVLSAKRVECKRLVAERQKIVNEIQYHVKRIDRYRKRRGNVVKAAAVVATVYVGGPAIASMAGKAGGAGAALKGALTAGKGVLGKLLIQGGMNAAKAKMMEETMKRYPPAPELNDPGAMFSDSMQQAANAQDDPLAGVKKVLPWMGAAALAAIGLMA